MTRKVELWIYTLVSLLKTRYLVKNSVYKITMYVFVWTCECEFVIYWNFSKYFGQKCSNSILYINSNDWSVGNNFIFYVFINILKLNLYSIITCQKASSMLRWESNQICSFSRFKISLWMFFFSIIQFVAVETPFLNYIICVVSLNSTIFFTEISTIKSRFVVFFSRLRQVKISSKCVSLKKGF